MVHLLNHLLRRDVILRLQLDAAVVEDELQSRVQTRQLSGGAALMNTNGRLQSLQLLSSSADGLPRAQRVSRAKERSESEAELTHSRERACMLSCAVSDLYRRHRRCLRHRSECVAAHSILLDLLLSSLLRGECALPLLLLLMLLQRVPVLHQMSRRGGGDANHREEGSVGVEERRSRDEG